MLSDEDEQRLGVDTVMFKRGNLQFTDVTNKESPSRVQRREPSTSAGNVTATVRKFILPKPKVKVKTYYQLADVEKLEYDQPPAVRHMDDAEIELIRTQPLGLKQPCHNQRVERHVKSVSDASAPVAGHDRGDGMIRQEFVQKNS